MIMTSLINIVLFVFILMIISSDSNAYLNRRQQRQMPYNYLYDPRDEESKYENVAEYHVNNNDVITLKKPVPLVAPPQQEQQQQQQETNEDEYQQYQERKQHYLERVQKPSSYYANYMNSRHKDLMDDVKFNALTNIEKSKTKKVASLDQSEKAKSVNTNLKSQDSSAECSVHGYWISGTANAAIELIPRPQVYNVHHIDTIIHDLPKNLLNPNLPPLVKSNWVGTGMISAVQPTTLTIVFQENRNDVNEDIPKTVVFTGQCLLCNGVAVLQGSWFVFPHHAECFVHKNSQHFKNHTISSYDTMYQFH